jgi:hypothetical protein
LTTRGSGGTTVLLSALALRSLAGNATLRRQYTVQLETIVDAVDV